MEKKKDDVINIRISKEEKIKMRALEMDFKNLSEYIMYAVMREIAETEINKLK